MRIPDEKYALQAITELSHQELLTDSRVVHNEVSRKDSQRVLQQRHLLGVIVRHSVSADRSLYMFKQAQNLMDCGEQDTYVIRQTFGHAAGKLVGLATVTPSLDLRKQPIPLPPAYARRLPWMSRPVDLGPVRANATAWTIHSNPRTMHYALGAAYSGLVHESPDTSLWTIEPSSIAYDNDYATGSALEQAGFSSAGEGYFDDQETRHEPIPHAGLFVRNVEIP